MWGLQVGLISTEHGVCLHHLTLWVIFICHPHIGGPTAVLFFFFCFLAGGKGFLNELFGYDCTSNFRPWYRTECTLNSNICLRLATVGRCHGTRPCANVLLSSRRMVISVPGSAKSSPLKMQMVKSFIPSILRHKSLSLGFSRLSRTTRMSSEWRIFSPFKVYSLLC